MKRIFLIIAVISVVFPAISAPTEEEKDVRDRPFRERFFFGGYLGLQFGTITSINISPTAGYLLTNSLSMGLGGTYQYYHNRGLLRTDNFNYSTHIYGGSLFARHLITPSIFAHIEFEALNLDSRIQFQAQQEGGRFWEKNYFAGGGYRQPLGPRTHLNLMLLYNFNPNSVIYHQNPVFRFGIDVGIR